MSAFTGKQVLVTGAASGIGRSTLLRLANDGYVVIGMDRDADGLQKITEEGLIFETQRGRAVYSFSKSDDI